jgi:hypothetical protein
VALKVRVFASKPLTSGRPKVELVYNAEGYDDQDPDERQRWSCNDDHPSDREARDCGNRWLAEQKKV